MSDLAPNVPKVMRAFYREGSLAPDYVERLNAVGFVWRTPQGRRQVIHAD